MTGATHIRDYAIEQMNHVLTTLAFQVHRAAKKPGSKEIHDLRVSIRRFSQGLRLFAGFFPEREVEKIRQRLKRMMSLTSEIRDRDIALEFISRTNPAAHLRLKKERDSYSRQFSEMVRRWSARDFSAKWRSRLSLRTV
jgi:CHAD domain-containing protein